MYSPMNSRHFTAHVNPNGVKYYLMTTHVAPVQQSFYFVNSGFSDDGRYLWFYCAFPPAAGHTVAVLDFLTDEITHFPETLGYGWMVDPLTGNLYWACSEGLYMRTPHPEDKAVCIWPMPADIKRWRIGEAATHLTFTPDRKEILIDVRTLFGPTFIGTVCLETGEYTEWYRTEGRTQYDHAQMSPVDPDLCLCAHEFSYDPELGRSVQPPYIDGIYPRLQLITRDGKREMRRPYGNFATHEWWAADGKSIYYVENGHICQDRLGENEGESLCYIPVEGGNGAWHAHCTADGQYFVVDGSHPYEGLEWWRGCPSMVRFWNRKTGKLADVCSYNPVVEGWTPQRPCIYHIDPHPRFVVGDQWIMFTATTGGRVEVAVAETEQLIRMTE